MTRKRAFFVVGFLLLWIILSSRIDNKTIRYTVTDLGILGGTPVEVHALNRRGEVVGRINTDEDALRHAFIWDATSGMTDITAIEGVEGEALDINDRGEVVGAIQIPNHVSGSAGGSSILHHAFFWNREVGLIDLHPEDFECSWARLINESGVIVGLVMNRPDGRQEHQTYLWETPRSPGGVISATDDIFVPEAISDRGEISGWFRRSRIRDGKDYSAMARSATGELLELEIPENCWSCGGVKMDASTTLTGLCSNSSSDPVAVVRWRDSNIIHQMEFGEDYEAATLGGVSSKGVVLINVSLTNIDPLSKVVEWGLRPLRGRGRRQADFSGPKATGEIWAEQISNFLQKVGIYKGGVQQRFPLLWNGEEFSDLNDLIPSDSGWELEVVGDINDGGQVVGRGIHNGVARAFLLDPLPLESSLP